MPSAFDVLTPKMQLFVTEYAADMNAFRAVQEAGYKGTKNALHVRANKLLLDPRIQKALAEVGTILDAKLLTVENLADQLARYNFVDPIEFVDEEGYLKCNLRDIPAGARQCIESWDIEETTRVIDKETGETETQRKIKVKLVPKSKAIELAMKWRNMLQPNQTTINNNTQNNIFDWTKFYENPGPIIEQRMKDAIEDGRIEGD